MAHGTSPGGVPIRLDITPSEHPSIIQGSGPGATAAKAAMGKMYESHGALIDLGKSVKDKTQIPGAATGPMEKAVSTAGEAQELLTSQIVTLAGEIATEIKGNPTPAAAEIRAYWNGKGSKRILELGQIFTEGKDRDTMAAILSGPAYLSGLTPDNMLMLRDQAAQSLCPEKRELLAETRTALGILDKAVETFTSKTTALLNRWASKDAKIIREVLDRKKAS